MLQNTVFSLLLALASTAAFAAGEHAEVHGPGTAAFADGEIRKVDKDNAKLTIRHGPLKSLDVPGMTMVFGVQDAALLDQVKPGEKVRFQAEKIDGKFVVTRIEAVQP